MNAYSLIVKNIDYPKTMIVFSIFDNKKKINWSYKTKSLKEKRWKSFELNNLIHKLKFIESNFLLVKILIKLICLKFFSKEESLGPFLWSYFYIYFPYVYDSLFPYQLFLSAISLHNFKVVFPLVLHILDQIQLLFSSIQD